MSYYERHLPHWQPEDAALFITWRLYGTTPRIPAPVQYQTQGKEFANFDREMDRAPTGPKWLLDDRVAKCVVDALVYGQDSMHLYTLESWVLMSHHVHILIYPAAKLARITKAIKNYSGRQANAILGRSGPFWHDESFDRWVRSEGELEKIVSYIESNPVNAGLVNRPEDYKWSSAFPGAPAGRPLLR